MRLVVIVPAFNEQQNIGAVIDSLARDVPQADVVVINDGSTDATAAIARSHGASILDLPFNLGIGGAVQAGLLHARNAGYDAALQFDGDGQHPAAEVSKILERMRRGDCDVVIGSRFVERSSYRGSLSRRAGIAVLSAVNSVLLRKRISDTTSGFRLFNRAAIEFLAVDYPHDFPEPESIVTLCRNGFRVVEEPVVMKERQGGRSSITFLRSIYYMCKVLIATVIGATRESKRKADHEPDRSAHRRGDERPGDPARRAAHSKAKAS